MRIALTGSSGYLGTLLAGSLERAGHQVIRLGRGSTPSFELARAAELSSEWGPALSHVDVLVHAGWDLSTKPLTKRRAINVAGSTVLFAAARAANVRRIVFLSSTLARADSRSQYGIAKREVEAMLDVSRDLALRIGWVLGRSPIPRVLAGILAASPWVPWPGTGDETVYCIGERDLVAAVGPLITSTESGVRYVMERQPLTATEFVARLLERSPPKLLPIPVGSFRSLAQRLDSLSDLRPIEAGNGVVVIP